jgi:hypothetical protein
MSTVSSIIPIVFPVFVSSSTILTPTRLKLTSTEQPTIQASPITSNKCSSSTADPHIPAVLTPYAPNLPTAAFNIPETYICIPPPHYPSHATLANTPPQPLHNRTIPTRRRIRRRTRPPHTRRRPGRCRRRRRRHRRASHALFLRRRLQR